MDFGTVRQEFLVNVRKDIAASISNDNLVMQTIQSIEELNKVCNALSKRFRHWLALTLPEAEHAFSDHEALITAILTKDWKELRPKNSMGKELSTADNDALLALAQQAKQAYLLREKLTQYLEKVMHAYCPNLLAVTGALVGAKLIDAVGSLKKLAEVHSSTIQLLGAEKALFRHMRNKNSKPPKHGFILQHPIVARAKQKGRAGRALADKIAIAARVDYFKGQFIGDQLRKQLEEKFP
ncbi:MAG: hypothetical protein V1725_01795 [archaeon]